MNEAFVKKIVIAIDRFVGWLDHYGETSYDHQSFFASDFGRTAKALYYRKPRLGRMAVSPTVFCDAFVPSARTLFWMPHRFPIASAHDAMAFSLLSHPLRKDHSY